MLKGLKSAGDVPSKSYAITLQASILADAALPNRVDARKKAERLRRNRSAKHHERSSHHSADTGFDPCGVSIEA
jgi:hypothetical protein